MYFAHLNSFIFTTVSASPGNLLERHIGGGGIEDLLKSSEKGDRGGEVAATCVLTKLGESD